MENMKNEKRWKKPEIKVLFSGNIDENVMWGTSFTKKTSSQEEQYHEDEDY